MTYLTLKHIHITAVTLSGALFLLRGLWMLLNSPRLQQRWVRIVPHLIDTVLLASAIAMVLISAQYPFVQSWLTAKVLALLVYIALGMLALKPHRPKAVRVVCWLAALAVFGYIVLVALRHNPWPFTL
ncbi:MAG: SirB2 family protein [Candidatus Competibacteraceae bacterium]|nr:SirB2 family protein [Candidatus Competibacteraceae bacterium]